jgi:hypothetical protein
MPVGLFRSEDGWAQVDYGTGATIPIPRSRYEANGYSRISTNFLRKLSTGPQRKRRTMMPRGPKGEKRPADAIGNAVMIAKIATGLRISNPPA